MKSVPTESSRAVTPRRNPVLSIQNGSLTLSGKTDPQNIAALLSAARGTLISLMHTLESAESLLPVDALDAPRRKAEQLHCLLLSAIEENRRAA